MDRDQALTALPVPYARALRLRAAGLDHAGLADHLGVPLEAVGPLLGIAEAKLARLLHDQPDSAD